MTAESAVPIGVVNWRVISGRDADVATVRLDNWVGWLCSRYAIEVELIPDCWWRHGTLVEELSALHTGWLASFDEHDGGAGPLSWHERFDLARARLRRHAERCAVGPHQDSLGRHLKHWPIDEGATK